jgi:hypothetical protein
LSAFTLRKWTSVEKVPNAWFKGYAPDTDLDNFRNRVVGILLGLLVTAFVFNYIWPERARIEISTSKEGMSVVS